jgi:hypothetical protein
VNRFGVPGAPELNGHETFSPDTLRETALLRGRVRALHPYFTELFASVTFVTVPEKYRFAQRERQAPHGSWKKFPPHG